MSENNRLSGSCLCGAVRLVAENPSQKVSACHCAMCRKWGGGPFMEINCGTDIVFTGEDHIRVYSSSEWAQRGFCQQCGSHLFYRPRQGGEYMVPVGLFDKQEHLVFDNQVFIDKKPGFYSFQNKTNEMTEEEVFKVFGPSQM